MSKAAVAKVKAGDAEIFPSAPDSPDPDKQERAEILRRARDRLVELRFQWAKNLADPAKRGNTNLPIEELIKVQNAIDSIDKAIADDRGRVSKDAARSS